VKSGPQHTLQLNPNHRAMANTVAGTLGVHPVNGRNGAAASAALPNFFRLRGTQRPRVEAESFVPEASPSRESPSVLTLYLREIGKVKLLSAEEEVELARRVQKGDEAAREQMIKANLRLVMKIARGFEHMGLPLLDLISEGNLGLMKAVERFNPAKGARLATYAAIWIKAHICRALSNHARTVRIPEHVLHNLHLINAAAARLQELLGREPTDGEIAQQIGLLSARVSQMREAIQATVSLDETLRDLKFRSVAETVADENSLTPYEVLAHGVTLEQVQQLNETLSQLSLRERSVLRSRFGLDGEHEQTFEQIGRRFGLTRERVRQIQNIALAKLRRKMGQCEAVRLAARCDVGHWRASSRPPAI
jgi:RNA polymerase primary sigma factor